MNLKLLIILPLFFLLTPEKAESSSRLLSEIIPVRNSIQVIRGATYMATDQISSEDHFKYKDRCGRVFPLKGKMFIEKLLKQSPTIGSITLYNNDPLSVENRNLYKALRGNPTPLFILMPDYTFNDYGGRIYNIIPYLGLPRNLMFAASAMVIDDTHGVSREDNGSDGLLTKPPQKPLLRILNTTTGMLFSDTFSYSTYQLPGTDIFIGDILKKMQKEDLYMPKMLPTLTHLYEINEPSKEEVPLVLTWVEGFFQGIIHKDRVCGNPVWSVTGLAGGKDANWLHPIGTKEPSPSKSRH
jgi:hypothetical protein